MSFMNLVQLCEISALNVQCVIYSSPKLMAPDCSNYYYCEQRHYLRLLTVCVLSVNDMILIIINVVALLN